MLSHNYVCTHVSNSDMVTVATNRQHIVSMAYTHTHKLYKKKPSFWFNASIFNFCTCILLNAIYGRVLCEIEGEYNNNGSKRRNKQKNYRETETEKETSFHLSIHLKRKNTIFVYIISFYICVSFCLCEFVAIAVARVRSFACAKLFSLAIYDRIVLPYIHIAAFTHKKYYLFLFFFFLHHFSILEMRSFSFACVRCVMLKIRCV